MQSIDFVWMRKMENANESENEKELSLRLSMFVVGIRSVECVCMWNGFSIKVDRKCSQMATITFLLRENEKS